MFPVCYYRPLFYALRRIWMKKFINKLKKGGAGLRQQCSMNAVIFIFLMRSR